MIDPAPVTLQLHKKTLIFTIKFTLNSYCSHTLFALFIKSEKSGGRIEVKK